MINGELTGGNSRVWEFYDYFKVSARRHLHAGGLAGGWDTAHLGQREAEKYMVVALLNMNAFL